MPLEDLYSDHLGFSEMNNGSYMLTRPSTASYTTLFTSWIILLLGLASLTINSFVILIILINRRRVLKNVFYVLVLHCAFVDLIRATALSIWCLPSLNIFSLDAVLVLMQAKKWVVIVLRSLNMLTVLNLLIFTTNEFIVVERPMQYKRIIRRRIVAIFLLFSWIACFSFAVGNSLAKNYSGNTNSVYVWQINSSSSEESFKVSTDEHMFVGKVKMGEIFPAYRDDNWHNRTQPKPRKSLLAREKTSSEEMQFPFLFTVIVVCMLCLILVFSCYAVMLRRIHNFKNCTDLRVATKNHTRHTGGNINTVKNGGYGSNSSRNSRFKAIMRHKYVLVIGTVLLVDILFLVPYSIIQVLQYLNLTVNALSGGWNAQPRLVLQFIIGIHSVLQPLCYFRMEDFRRLAFCRRMLSQSREFNTSKSRPTARPSAEIEDDDESNSKKYSDVESLRSFQTKGSVEKQLSVSNQSRKMSSDLF